MSPGSFSPNFLTFVIADQATVAVTYTVIVQNNNSIQLGLTFDKEQLPANEEYTIRATASQELISMIENGKNSIYTLEPAEESNPNHQAQYFREETFEAG